MYARDVPRRDAEEHRVSDLPRGNKATAIIQRGTTWDIYGRREDDPSTHFTVMIGSCDYLEVAAVWAGAWMKDPDTDKVMF